MAGWVPLRLRKGRIFIPAQAAPSGGPGQQVPGQQAVRPNSGSRLLDAADLSVGSSQVIPSALAVSGSTAPVVGNPQKLVDLTAESKFGQVVTVCVGAEISQPGVTATVLTGPVAAKVEFGNGGSGNPFIEFDVPAANQFPSAVSGYPPSMQSTFGSGVAVSLPAGALRIYLRNQNNELPVYQGGDGQKIIGSTLSGGSVDPTCFAFATYGHVYGGNARLRKTIYISNNSALPPYTGLLSQIAYIGVPRFARSVSIYRDALDVTTFSVFFTNTFASGPSGPFVLGPNDVGPIVIPPVTSQIQVKYTTTGDSPSNVSAIFELDV